MFDLVAIKEWILLWRSWWDWYTSICCKMKVLLSSCYDRRLFLWPHAVPTENYQPIGMVCCSRVMISLIRLFPPPWSMAVSWLTKAFPYDDGISSIGKSTFVCLLQL